MLFGLLKSKSKPVRTSDRRPLKLEELSPRLMLSGTGTDNGDLIPPPPPPTPVEIGPS